MKTKHCPATRLTKAPTYKPLTELEIAKIIAKVRQGILSGMIDGEESAGVLFNLLTTRKYD